MQHWANDELQITHPRKHPTPGQVQRQPASHRAMSCLLLILVEAAASYKLKNTLLWFAVNQNKSGRPAGASLLPTYSSRYECPDQISSLANPQRSSFCYLIPVCSCCYCVHQGLASQSVLPLKFILQSAEHFFLM